MTKRFNGKRILVTGAATGLGLAIARRFLSEGARVAMSDLRHAALDQAARALKSDRARIAVVVFDVRDARTVSAGVTAAVDSLGGLDVLVNNAGLYPSHGILDMDEAAWDAVLETNLKGPFLVSQAFARHRVEQGEPGAIVNITSGSAQRARFGAAHYSASKAGLEMLTRSCALELARHRIRVNAVSPSFIDTRSPLNAPDSGYADAIQATRPWPRAGTPEDVAQAVAYLCSDESEWITGTTLRVDGGRSTGDNSLPSTQSDSRTT